MADRARELSPPPAPAVEATSDPGPSTSADDSGAAASSAGHQRRQKRRRKQREQPAIDPPLLYTPKRIQPLRIDLANRNTTAHSTVRHLIFPRRPRSTANPGLGSAELASLLRVIRLIVDNLRSNQPPQTKRDLFYADVPLFNNQRTVDVLVDDLAATMGCRRFDLGVIASAKGVFTGCCCIITTSGHVLDGAAGGTHLIPPAETIERVDHGACNLVLVVEKEAVFQGLREQLPRLLSAAGLQVVLICGKGQPDVASRELVSSLAQSLPVECVLTCRQHLEATELMRICSIPMLCLVDFDPHGMRWVSEAFTRQRTIELTMAAHSIFATYQAGSSAMAFDTQRLIAHRLELLDISRHLTPFSDQTAGQVQRMTEADRRKALAMLSQISLPSICARALSVMLHRNLKAEIEALAANRWSIADALSPVLIDTLQGRGTRHMQSQSPM